LGRPTCTKSCCQIWQIFRLLLFSNHSSLLLGTCRISNDLCIRNEESGQKIYGPFLLYMFHVPGIYCHFLCYSLHNWCINNNYLKVPGGYIFSHYFYNMVCYWEAKIDYFLKRIAECCPKSNKIIRIQYDVETEKP